MLYLCEKDLLRLLDCGEIIESIERAYDIQGSGEYIMPDRMHLYYDDNTLLYMPCVIESSYCTKLVTVFPDNKERGLPVVDGIVVLNDKKTGKIKALIDGKTLTAIRTGAVGGTAVKYLTHEAVKTLGIIGCGVQGYYQAVFADYVRDFDKVLIYDGHGYNSDFETYFGDRLRKVSSTNELVEKSDVIITATTSYEPLFDTDCVTGKTFIGIGSFKPNMREYNDDFIKAMDYIVADTSFAKLETGDLKIPLDTGVLKHGDIRVFKPEKMTGTIFFKSVGMALFDNVVAEKLYEGALENKLGQVLEV